MGEAAAIILVFGLFGWLAKKIYQNTDEQEQQEEFDFDSATVSEKFQMAKETSDALNSMEQLVTDLDVCNEHHLKVVCIKWVGGDGVNHEYDLYCDGTNAPTQCLRAIAEREAHEQREILAYQCKILAAATRHRKNDRQNDGARKGEWLRENAL